MNAVRLHAEPYPSFFLDMADEMGILVLDETAVWASDGGPKLDDPAFWADADRHLRISYSATGIIPPSSVGAPPTR